MIDSLASEYKWGLEYITEQLPLCKAFALYRAIVVRYDVDGLNGPSFEDEDMLENMSGFKSAIKTALRNFKRGLKKRRQS
jgi:hypothetical protein